MEREEGEGVMRNESYRCHETIDLEDIIKMKQEQFCTKSKAIITYASGRVEEIHNDLKKGGGFKKAFQSKVDEYRNFPTVKSVEVSKY